MIRPIEITAIWCSVVTAIASGGIQELPPRGHLVLCCLFSKTSSAGFAVLGKGIGFGQSGAALINTRVESLCRGFRSANTRFSWELRINPEPYDKLGESVIIFSLRSYLASLVYLTYIAQCPVDERFPTSEGEPMNCSAGGSD